MRSTPPDGCVGSPPKAHRQLVASLEEWPDGEQFTNYRRACAQSLARYLQHRDEFGAALEAQDLDEVAELLGHRPDAWTTAEAELEEFVLAAGPEHDVPLLQFFYRWQRRQEFMLRDAGPSSFAVARRRQTVAGRTSI